MFGYYKLVTGVKNVNLLPGRSSMKEKKKQEIYNRIVKVMKKKKDELQGSGEMTQKEKQKFVPWKEKRKLRRLLGREVNLSRL